MVRDVFDNVVAADRLGFKVPPDLRLVLRSQQREIVRISCNFQMLETTFIYFQKYYSLDLFYSGHLHRSGRHSQLAWSPVHRGVLLLSAATQNIILMDISLWSNFLILRYISDDLFYPNAFNNAR